MEAGANDLGRGMYRQDCTQSRVEWGACLWDDSQVRGEMQSYACIGRTTGLAQGRSLVRVIGENQGRCMSGSTAPNIDSDPSEPRDARL